METKILNAKIKSAPITIERGFMVCAGIIVQMSDGTECMFGGGYMLGNANDIEKNMICPNILAFHVGQIMNIAEVQAWDKLPGKTIRVESEGLGGGIIAIGNIIKDEWYHIKDTMHRFEDEIRVRTQE